MSNRSYLVPRPPAFDHEHPQTEGGRRGAVLRKLPKMVRIMVSPHRSQNHMGPPPRMVDTHLPPQTIRDDHPANTKGNEMKMKKTLMDMIIKWHQAGYSLDEISPLVPQVPKEEIKAIIQQHHE
jgi:hypothetical protein